MRIKNLFKDFPKSAADELVETLVDLEHVTLERIVSQGEVTPEGEWCDQERHEWVVLLTGAAKLRFEDSTELISLLPGDWLDIPPHKKHRVEWTDPETPTVWIALHYEGPMKK